MSNARRSRLVGATALGVAVTLTPLTAVHAAEPVTISLVSVTTKGAQSEFGRSREPAISGDGRYVAFTTDGSLASNDDNWANDVYLRDTTTGTTELISVGPAGAAASGTSGTPRVSSGGRYVVFTSNAALTPDSNGWSTSVYLRDRAAATTTRVGPAAIFQSPEISADGRYVTFSTFQDLVPEDRNSSYDVYVWDRTTAGVSVVSKAADGHTKSGDSREPAISGDGQYVSYSTNVPELVGGGQRWRVVLTDRQSGTTTVVSVPHGGTVPDSSTLYGPASISGDGNWVVFNSTADNLVPGDRNGVEDIFLWERATGAITAVSVNAAGTTADGPSMRARISSGTGRSP